MLWDIHGTPSEATTTNAGSATNDPLHDLFSRPAFSDFTSGETATVGPFDPQAANETLLSDGRLNADDAPMPALRVDVSIAENKGKKTWAAWVRSRVPARPRSTATTSRATRKWKATCTTRTTASTFRRPIVPWPRRPGVTGPSPGGNFPGFLQRAPKPVHVLDLGSQRQRKVLVFDGMPAPGAGSVN